jgi:hypothetical protein
MNKKTKQQNRKVNMMLSNGLYIISTKHRTNTPLFVLYLTDFVVNTRVIFDAETLKTLPNKYGVEIVEKDREALVKALEYEVKKVEVVANPLPVIVSNVMIPPVVVNVVEPLF